MVPDCYLEEFKANSDWLCFAYHVRDNAEELSEKDADTIEAEFLYAQDQLQRITGSITTTIRLDRFQGSREVVRRLKSHGLNVLLTADDNRQSYYFEDEKENRFVANHDCYEDDLMTFVSTDFRLDRKTSLQVCWCLFRTALNRSQNRLITVFSHEWQLDDNTFHNIENVCIFARKNHYRFELDLANAVHSII